MPYLALPHVRLAFEDRGTGLPITFLHGFTQSKDSWREIIECMPPRWRWILADLRGHGETEVDAAQPHTLEACQGDLEQLWDHLGIARGHLVGYSMGGRLALHIAVHRSDRLLSLVTIGAHAGLTAEERSRRQAADEDLAGEIEAEGVEAFVQRWSNLPLFAGQARRGPEFLALQRAERLRNRPAGLAASLRGMGAGAMEPLWGRLGTLRCPTLFVAGAEDPRYVAHAEGLAAGVRGGRALAVAGAGHAVHLERPDGFAALLVDHLLSVEVNRPPSRPPTGRRTQARRPPSA